MRIDANLDASITEVAGVAKRLEAEGFDGVVTTEISSDPFFPLLLAAEHTEHLELMTSIALAFARNPMLLADIGNDLQAFSQGRFLLGIGSQIEPHITNRFSMPWSDPAARMREFILAMRAIWGCWYEDKPLDFKGDYYTHTLMTPTFVPKTSPHGAPPVLLAAAERLAFYGSTPAYRGVLETHGWGRLQPELNAMSKRGEWAQMGEKITDEILETFAVVAEPHEVAERIRERYAGLVDRVVCDFAELADEDRSTALRAVRS